MKTKDYCRALKARLGVTSDYELAKRLGVTRQGVSNYVNGLRAFDTLTAAKVAHLLELDPLQVIADMELERAKSQDVRDVWKRIRDAAVVAAMAIGAASFGAPGPAHAGVLHNFFSGGVAAPSGVSLYALHANRRRARGGLRAFVAWVLGVRS